MEMAPKLQFSTLRPGLLVSLKTSIKGNVNYKVRTLEGEHVTSDGASRSKWETVRRVTDPAEFELAKKARSKARNIITGVCSATSFGLLCPEAKGNKLAEAIVEARRVTSEFNKKSSVTNVQVYIITGRIAPDDAEAIRSINSEVRDLMDRMKEGIKNLDAKVIREAANQAKKVATMLNPESFEKAQRAIGIAREVARKIVKAGEGVVQEVDQIAIKNLTAARTAFLDLEDRPVEAITPRSKVRTAELGEVETPPPAKPKKSKQAAAELDA